MKYIIIISILTFNITANDFKSHIIKYNNKLKVIKAKIYNNKIITSQKYSFTNSSNLQIKFNKITPDIIKDFEQNYNLRLVEVLVIGDYIYSHNSNDILNLIKQISSNENIKSIKPLWSIPFRKY